MCWGKNIKAVTSAEDGGATLFLDAVNCDSEKDVAWHKELLVCGKMVRFKIDTGTDITAMSESTYHSLPHKPKLQPSRSILRGPGGQLDCKGQFIAETIHKGTKFSFRIYMIGGSQVNNLLSHSAASKMELVQTIEEVSQVFGDIGLLNCKPVTIKLKVNVVPYSVTSPKKNCLPTPA